MAAIVTPSQMNKRSDFYAQLGSLTAAGVPIIQSLEHVAKNPPSRSYVAPVMQMVDRLQRGSTFSESLRSLGHWTPIFDIALLTAGEQSGRLDACFRLLADHYKISAQLLSQTLSGMMYPVFIIHLAILIFPPEMLRKLVWESAVWPFVIQKLSILAPIYLVVYILLHAKQSHHSQKWRGLIEKVISKIPLWGSAHHNMTLARLSSSLEALISAGVPIAEAWQTAGAASGSPAMQKAIDEITPQVLKGDPPGDFLPKFAIFPQLFSSMYRTGEISGQLDQTLRRMHQHFQHEATLKYKNLAEWVPRLMILGVVICVGYFIVQFWMNYYNNLFNTTF